ncbi:MAG: hypothetical protein MUP55_02590 [Candidatus Aenigmarchaeota archaeon]|nr:hypothetical protein [Candidatus Aenigmarchaeota archaeon]
MGIMVNKSSWGIFLHGYQQILAPKEQNAEKREFRAEGKMASRSSEKLFVHAHPEEASGRDEKPIPFF